MMRQAVPLIRPKAPLVGSGMEYTVSKDDPNVANHSSAKLITSIIKIN